MDGTDPTKQTPSIGIIVDPLPLRAWAHEVLEQILDQDLARIVYVATVASTGSHLEGTVPLQLYSLLDRLILPRHPCALQRLPDSPLLQKLPMFDLGHPDELPPGKQLEEVDLVINLSCRVVTDVLATSTLQTAWSLPKLSRQVWQGVEEVYERRPVYTVAVEATFSDSADSLVLLQAHCATDFFSVGRTRNTVLWKGGALIIRALERWSGPASDLPPIEKQDSDAGQPVRAVYSATVLLAKIFGRLIRDGADKLFYRRRWSLIARAAKEFSEDFGDYRPLLPPKSCAWADPCALTRGERHYVFIEQIPPGTSKGHLAVLEMNADEITAHPQIILEQPYHLSHPFVFEWAGDTYMVPESSANGSVDLYRCTDFPTRWEFCKSLMTGVRAVDATLLDHNGRWWMFVTLADHKGATTRDELFLFSNRQPVDEGWQPHPFNPIVADARRARPAGSIFQQNGKLVRPAQDCSHRYGYGIRMMEIVTLDEERYEESEIASYTPDWDGNVVGLHTIHRSKGLTVLDVKQSTLRLRNSRS